MGKRLLFIATVLIALSYGFMAYTHATIAPPTITPFVSTLHERIPKTLSVSFVGDMVPTENDTYNASVFLNLGEVLAHADLSIGNLEGTFAQKNRSGKCSLLLPTCFAFRGSASFASSMRAAGINLVSLVNNHSLDFGTEGREDTEKVLQEKGFDFISQAFPTKEITVNEFTVGLLGVSSSPPEHTIENDAYIASTISDLKTRNDFVILVFHGGAEGADKTFVPGKEEFVGNENRGDVQKVAYTAIDAGADLVLGSGPHVLRKIETYHGKLIAYSLGNFVGGNGKLNTRGILGISGILNVTLSKENNPSYTFTSVTLTKEGVPLLDDRAQGPTL